MKMTEKMKTKENYIFWCLFGIFLTGALPLFTNYCLNASEVPYQLVRLEELQENLSAGIFRIAMPVNWQYEHGTAGLDGNLFWLLPVFLRKIGLPLESAYRCFLMCIYAAGVILSYVTFREVFRDWKLVIFSTMLYCWAPWYIDTLYGRAAIGEALGYAFLPVLLLFVVRMVGQKEGKLPQWVLLTLGTTLLLQSSFAVFIVGMLMLLFCCIYYRRQMLGRAGLWTLGKAVIATVVCNLWYLLPLLRYLVAYRDVARYLGSRPFQEKGASLMHYLTFFFHGGTAYDYKANGFQGAAATGVGPALTALFFLLLWLKFSGSLSKKDGKKEITSGLFWCGMLGILLSLGSFPWDLLRRNVVFQVLTFSIQSPVIFMIPAVCGMVLAGCGVLEYYRRERSFAEATILEIAVAAVAFVSTQFLTNKLLLTREPLWIRQKEDLPELVLVEAPQLQMSAAGGSLQWGTVAIGILGVAGIVIYCIFRQRKDRKQEVQKEAA